jgi:hypothetical protein
VTGSSATAASASPADAFLLDIASLDGVLTMPGYGDGEPRVQEPVRDGDATR